MNSHSLDYIPDLADFESPAVKSASRQRPNTTPSAFRTIFHPLLVKTGSGTLLAPLPIPAEIEREGQRESGLQHIICPVQINFARRINKFLEAANRALTDGGLLMICCEANHQRKRRIFSRSPAFLGQLVLLFDFLLNRVIPKLAGINRLYFKTPLARYRALSETEILGRLVCCGFEIADRREKDGLIYLAARKADAPSYDPQPTYGPLCRLRRSGYQGREIKVFKLRTMHPYSEYLQDYVYRTNSLNGKGKFNDDFRITRWGRWCRRLWIDEIPMLWNWIRGDLKLVGVRPLSAHYLSLYPRDVQELRKRHKPGLLPPYYADMPKTLEEIADSERRYLLARESAPVKTDILYFFRALGNIVLKGARSG